VLTYIIRSPLLVALRRIPIVYLRYTKSHSQRPDYKGRRCPRPATPHYSIPTSSKWGRGVEQAKSTHLPASRGPGILEVARQEAHRKRPLRDLNSDSRCAQPPPTAGPPALPLRTGDRIISHQRVGPLSDSLPKVKCPSPNSTNWASKKHPL
jgi:hypothetical protein